MALDFIKRLFGKSEPPSPPATTASASKPARPAKPSQKQVFEGRETEPAAFAMNTGASQLVKRCLENVACRYPARISQQRIYRPGVRLPDGNLAIEYEGVSVTCPAIKDHGLEIAAEDGYVRAYRYADLNHIYECCCGDPTNCRFYNKAERARNSAQRDLR